MRRILLVEDYLPHARLIGWDLAEAGYDVSTRPTGEAALAEFETLTPNLILLDWQLPGQSGVDICRQLRANGFTGPIVFVTAMAGTEHRQVGLAAGANDYVTKPFSPETLMGTIAQYL
ncbi:MAG: response regulator transcription factor [Leptolyngbyaceae cyanobacterium]